MVSQNINLALPLRRHSVDSSIAISLLILRRLTYRRLILPGSSATSSAATHRRLICLSIWIPAVPALVCSSCLHTLRWLVVHRHTSLIDLLHLLLYIRPILNVLLELANVAVHCVPGLQAKWYDRNETKGEPFPSLDDLAGEIATVLALDCDVFVALQ